MPRIATWNLENLFRPGGESGPRTPAAYEAKLTALAERIDALDVDVLAVQEVGEPEALADLVARLDGAWSTALSRFPDDRGIRVGFIARPALRDVQDVRDIPPPVAPVQIADDGTTLATTGRGALRVRVELDGRAVDLLTCHLKSKLLSYPGGRFAARDEGERARYGAYAVFQRAAEAVALRAEADRLLANRGDERAVVLLGDLNDTVEAATTQVLLGPPGSELGTAGETVPDQGDPSRLWNLAPRIPEDERWSRVYRGRPELIDHIMVSDALRDDVTEVHAGDADLPSIDDDPRERRDAPGSDHSPVVVTLRS